MCPVTPLPVLSVDNTLLCMFQRSCTYFQDRGVLILGGRYFSGHSSQQQISVKNEEVLIFGGVLIYGVLRYSTREAETNFKLVPLQKTLEI